MPDIAPAFRPNKLTKNKDADYHAQWGRFAASSANTTAHNAYTLKCMVNWSFYMGNQWIMEEDISNFLMDETGEARNRIRFWQNMIKPVVNTLVGGAIDSIFEFEAEPIGLESKLRKDIARNKKMFMHKIMEQDIHPAMKESLKKKQVLGDTIEETQRKFENEYMDTTTNAVNRLAKMVADINNFDWLKYDFAKNLAVAGIMIPHNYAQDGEQVFKSIFPPFFYFDHNAIKSDLSDSEFMGHYDMLDGSSIYEKYQYLTPEEKEAIEMYLAASSPSDTALMNILYNTSTMIGRIPVYHSYWKDIESSNYAYVKDASGVVSFERLKNNKDDDTTPFTDEDIVEPPEKIRPDLKRKFYGAKGKKKIIIWDEVTRFCSFIPSEYLGGTMGRTQEKYTDIVLDFGIVPYMETKNGSPSVSEFPYKPQCWDYVAGQVLTPLDDIIPMQRFVNRVLSAAEAEINNSGGQGVIMDNSLAAGLEGGQEIVRNMRKNKPVFVNSQLMLNNAISTYNMSLGQNANILFGVIKEITGLMDATTGVNAQMKGSNQSYNELVGVQEQKIEAGNKMQGTYYYALLNGVKCMYHSIVNQGVRIYADSQRALFATLGDDSGSILITDDIKYEPFRVKMRRAQSEETEIQTANQLLFQFKQFDLIDDKRLAKLFGKATTSEVALASQMYVAEKEEAKRQSMKQQQQEQQQQEQQQQGMMAQQRGDMLSEKEKDRQHDLDKIHAKGAVDGGNKVNDTILQGKNKLAQTALANQAKAQQPVE